MRRERSRRRGSTAATTRSSSARIQRSTRSRRCRPQSSADARAVVQPRTTAATAEVRGTAPPPTRRHSARRRFPKSTESATQSDWDRPAARSAPTSRRGCASPDKTRRRTRTRCMRRRIRPRLSPRLPSFRDTSTASTSPDATEMRRASPTPPRPASALSIRP